jgi:hypothetical protein
MQVFFSELEFQLKDSSLKLVQIKASRFVGVDLVEVELQLNKFADSF